MFKPTQNMLLYVQSIGHWHINWGLYKKLSHIFHCGSSFLLGGQSHIFTLSLRSGVQLQLVCRRTPLWDAHYLHVWKNICSVLLLCTFLRISSYKYNLYQIVCYVISFYFYSNWFAMIGKLNLNPASKLKHSLDML